MNANKAFFLILADETSPRAHAFGADVASRRGATTASSWPPCVVAGRALARLAGSVIHDPHVAAHASMKMLSQDEGLISPRDWKLNAERQVFSC